MRIAPASGESSPPAEARPCTHPETDSVKLAYLRHDASMPDRLPAKPEDALPESSAPYGPCTRCSRTSNFTVVGIVPVTYDTSGAYALSATGGTERLFDQQVAILQCQGCRQNVVVIEEQYIGGRRKRDGGVSGGTVQWRGIHWWPSLGMTATDPSVPTNIASAVAEANRCLAASSPRAAAVMFRGALAEIVAARGSAEATAQHSLAAQLKQMAADGALDATLADWADHVRTLGNAGAHPNELEPVTVEEAEDLSRLTSALLEYLYVHPARVQRSRDARG